MRDLIIYSNGLYDGYGSKEWSKDFPNEKEIEKALEFIKAVAFKKLKRPNQRCDTSYGIKHIAEGFLRLKYGDNENCYISNGAFIEAMKRQGYLFERSKDVNLSVNAVFNISTSEVRKIRLAVRHN